MTWQTLFFISKNVREESDSLDEEKFLWSNGEGNIGLIIYIVS